jgi:hypothetical protein
VQSLVLLDWNGAGVDTTLQLVTGASTPQAIIAGTRDAQPSTITASPSRLPVSSLRVVATPQALYQEQGGISVLTEQGRSVTFRYALRDALGGSRVSTAGLSVYPVVQDSTGVRSQMAAGFTCPVSGIDVATGVGSCTIEVPPRLFPTSASSSKRRLLLLEVQVRLACLN